MKNEILETGLSAEYKEPAEGRDPVKEMEEDIKIYKFILDGAEKRINDLLSRKDDLGLQEKDLKAIEGIGDYIKEVKTDLFKVSESGELFATLPDNDGREQSVKPAALKQVQQSLRRLSDLMSGLDNLGFKVTPSFEKAEGFTEALSGGKDQFYDRYFSKKTAEKEEDLSSLVGEKVALFNSGMAAIETVLREEGLRDGETILVGNNFYSQTKEILEDYEKKGIRVARVDTGNTDEVVRKLNELRPKLLMLETIANAPSMEVADIGRLMEEVKKLEKEYSLHFIIDNTFLTPIFNNLSEKTRNFWEAGKSPVIAVESATKYYQWGLDNINAGIVYTDNEEYLENLKKSRAKIGTNLQGKLTTFLPELPRDLWEIKIKRHFDNASILAKHLAVFSGQLDISYPGLESHRDYQTLKKEYQGAGGIIYLSLKEGLNGEEIVNQMKKEAEKEGIGLNIGGSFGHPETWVVTVNRGTKEKPDWFVRVAAGSENIGDFKKVIAVFEKVFQK